ncbi:8-oxo-dGTP diphosphatase MutT [uncultured Exiguobacterium sp.]|uniref:8-oxo-dGTP diphosphatase MutT n=1 Tax=uncultured Exiguobacterium sp. TaxID=202669 RepID=UPI0025F04A9F|nr:8-oxo-dGTP diphosphatase MutT [uncultured Exiguobacterium sp.]
MKKHVQVVGAVIRNDHNEILCALRSSQMSLPNLWEFPGGKIEIHETPSQSLVREINEELKCKIKVKQPIEKTTYEYDAITVTLHTFEAEIVTGEPIAIEHAELRWVAVSDLDQLEWAPADIPTVEYIKKEFAIP